MQKRGAVRNLFNTTVDRDELQKQAAQLENESLATLQSYRLDSIIGVIESANDDQARKPKKSPRYDEGSDDEEPIRITRARIESDGAESSSADQEQPSLSTSSKKSSDLKLIASTRIPLPRGQKTLKGEIIYFLLIFDWIKSEKKKSGQGFFFFVWKFVEKLFRSIFNRQLLTYHIETYFNIMQTLCRSMALKLLFPLLLKTTHNSILFFSLF